MPATTVHGIYTEDKTKRGILRLAAARFESFTVSPQTATTGESASSQWFSNRWRRPAPHRGARGTDSAGERTEVRANSHDAWDSEGDQAIKCTTPERS
jgi:hypothetical protein